ncbi:hypothetical protein ACLOJK_004237 [Asimina triloba]
MGIYNGKLHKPSTSKQQQKSMVGSKHIVGHTIQFQQQTHSGPHNSIPAASRAGQHIVKLNCRSDRRAKHGNSNVITFKEAVGINFHCRRQPRGRGEFDWGDNKVIRPGGLRVGVEGDR